MSGYGNHKSAVLVKCGLRDYGIEPQVWDGDRDCSHQWKEFKHPPKGGHSRPENPPSVGANRSEMEEGISIRFGHTSNFCSLCGAWRGSLGLEPTPGLYIKHLCDIFDEIKRVLKKTGSIWVNLGDSYSGSWGNRSHRPETKHLNRIEVMSPDMTPPTANLKSVQPKSLVGIPEMFALEMIKRGWILRNKIVWWKPNCMPSSANDRFTVDFEYLYFFTKSQKYFFERQFGDLASATIKRSQSPFYPEHPKAQEWRKIKDLGTTKMGRDAQTFNEEVYKKIAKGEKVTRNKRTTWQMTKEEYLEWQADVYDVAKMFMESKNGSVWKISTEAFKEAHFATFARKLVQSCLLPGCPEFVCSKCGKPRFPIVKTDYRILGNGYKRKDKTGVDLKELNTTDSGGYRWDKANAIRKTIGYTDCGCGEKFEGGVCLDPFMGSGRVAVVALKLRRKFIGIELKPEYVKMAEKGIKPLQAQGRLL